MHFWQKEVYMHTDVTFIPTHTIFLSRLEQIPIVKEEARGDQEMWIMFVCFLYFGLHLFVYLSCQSGEICTSPANKNISH